MEEIKEALKVIKEECKKNSLPECENNCLIYKLLGECVDANVPEAWEYKE